MNKLITLILGQRRLMLTLAVMMTLSGVVSWMTMPRQEDPRLPPRVGLVTVIYPGADPLDVERLIIKPIEDELATVPQIVHVSSTARLGFAAMTVQLSDTVDLKGTERAWEEVRQALELADRGCILENGRMVRSDAASTLLADEGIVSAYLGI